MLQKLSDHALRALEVADYFRNLHDDDYSQSSCTKCVAGHIASRFCGMFVSNEQGVWDVTFRTAQRFLGLTDMGAGKLFASGPGNYVPRPDDAARVLNHLALTGVVDWQCR